MRRIRLKFPDSGQHDRRIDFALLLIGALVLCAVFYQFRQASEELNYWSNRVERLEKQHQPKVTHRARSSRNREREYNYFYAMF